MKCSGYNDGDEGSCRQMMNYCRVVGETSFDVGFPCARLMSYRMNVSGIFMTSLIDIVELVKTRTPTLNAV